MSRECRRCRFSGSGRRRRRGTGSSSCRRTMGVHRWRCWRSGSPRTGWRRRLWLRSAGRKVEMRSGRGRGAALRREVELRERCRSKGAGSLGLGREAMNRSLGLPGGRHSRSRLGRQISRSHSIRNRKRSREPSRRHNVRSRTSHARRRRTSRGNCRSSRGRSSRGSISRGPSRLRCSLFVRSRKLVRRFSLSRRPDHKCSLSLARSPKYSRRLSPVRSRRLNLARSRRHNRMRSHRLVRSRLRILRSRILILER